MKEIILVTIRERYEAFIAALENTKNFCEITLVEVFHVLHELEQTKILRHVRTMEGIYLVKS